MTVIDDAPSIKAKWSPTKQKNMQVIVSLLSPLCLCYFNNHCRSSTLSSNQLDYLCFQSSSVVKKYFKQKNKLKFAHRFNSLYSQHTSINNHVCFQSVLERDTKSQTAQSCNINHCELQRISLSPSLILWSLKQKKNTKECVFLVSKGHWAIFFKSSGYEDSWTLRSSLQSRSTPD